MAILKNLRTFAHCITSKRKKVSESTAILLFSKFSWSATEQEKAFARGQQGHNHQIASLLFQHTWQIAQKTQLPLYWVQDQNQQGDTFGEKLSHAIATTFEKSQAQQLIIIGDDCPTLSVGDFDKTLKAFASQKSTLGFAKDGGAYLIGIKRESFEATSFQALPWQTDKLGEELADYLTQNEQGLHCLRTKSDVDNAKDWQKTLSTLHFRHFIKQAWATLKSKMEICPPQKDERFFSLEINTYQNLRAPPPFHG